MTLRRGFYTRTVEPGTVNRELKTENWTESGTGNFNR